MSSGTRVLIAGGGVAALEAALALRELAGERVQVELVAPETHFWYRPLAVTEPFGLGEVQRFGLSDLAAAAGAHFSLAEVVAVDAERHVVRTAFGMEIPYDALLLATGAIPRAVVDGALTFRGPADTGLMRELLQELEAGTVSRVVVAVPLGAVWALPAYELALLISRHAATRGLADVEVALVTPEDEPLQLFGRAASAAVQRLLDERGITLHTHAHPFELREGGLRTAPDAVIPADRVVALPRLEGGRIDGLAQNRDGFVVVDAHGRAAGVADVFAAGDVTNFPVKQGGLAAQQALAAAEAIAADAGADVEPVPFKPVLRGLLLTGERPRYLRQELSGGGGDTSEVDVEPLWWPPAKIAGRYLAPFLAQFAGGAAEGAAPESGDDVAVDVELDDGDLASLATRRVTPLADETEETPTVETFMREVLAVAPDDTLGEVAERMREREVGSALVSDYGRLIGILTSRDFTRAFAARVHPSEARAREWMTAEPITVGRDATLTAALQVMSEHAVHHLPVVEGERAVGMVEVPRLARAVAELARAQSGVGLGF
jgi:sulfide:quinone oxidoreductase